MMAGRHRHMPRNGSLPSAVAYPCLVTWGGVEGRGAAPSLAHGMCSRPQDERHMPSEYWLVTILGGPAQPETVWRL